VTPLRWSPPRTLWIALAVSAVVIVVVVLWRRGQVDPLPTAVRIAVTNEKADRARVDSQLAAASLEAAAAYERQLVSEARADSLQSTARRLSRRADQLAADAALARTAADSAEGYRLAYLERTEERDTLLTTIAQKNISLAEAESRVKSEARRADIANAGRQRADSVLDAVVASVTVCTVPGTFGRMKCPSRRTALAVGIIGGFATEEIYRAARDGRIAIPVPFLRRAAP
jgi:hypothetical protein